MTTRTRQLLTLTVVGLMLAGAAALLHALPTPTQFELEGNATVEGPGDDWANTVPTPSATSEAIASVFVADGSGNATIFTTGGSKDVNDITAWQWKDLAGGLPDKDNITNAYAAAYVNPAGDLTFYFGADRFANDGDAQMGFWFFKSQVLLNPNGTFSGPGGVPAAHQNGDVLVVVNMTNGGAEASAVAFRWLNGGLVPFATEINSALCGSNADPDLCVISNAGDIPSPWAYQAKGQGSLPNVFPTFSFIEGGVNVTILGGSAGAGCFSSFLAETRSSTSTTATLKDFALGQFNTCDIDISKACPTVTFDALTGLLTYTSNITVTNKGFGTVFDVTVLDTPSAPAPAQTFTLASLATGASHTFTHTFTYTPSLTTPNPPINTAVGSAATFAGGPQIIDAGTAQATCPRVEFDASLSISKTCTSGLEVQNGRLVVVVTVTGQVCNVAPAPGGPFPESIGSVSVTDTPAFEGGTIALGTLASGECKQYTATYYPDALTGGSPAADDQVFEDTAAAQGTGAITGTARANTASANCPLCPPSTAAH